MFKFLVEIFAKFGIRNYGPMLAILIPLIIVCIIICGLSDNSLIKGIFFILCIIVGYAIFSVYQNINRFKSVVNLDRNIEIIKVSKNFYDKTNT